MRLQRLQRRQNTKVDDNLIEQSRPEQALHHRSLFCRLFPNRSCPWCSNYITVDQFAFCIFVFFFGIFVFLFLLFPNRSRPLCSNYITVESRRIVIRFYMRLMPCFSQNFLNVSPAGQTLPHEKSRQKSSKKGERGRGDGEGGTAAVA